MKLSMWVAPLVLIFVLSAAPAVPAQRIPEVPKPTIVGSFCPYCKGYFDTPNGKMPSACPHCGRSFVQQAVPSATPPAAAHSDADAPQPSDDRLYYDGTVTKGGLKTRHFEKDGLPAKAEAWGKEMRQVDAQSRSNQAARVRAFERDKDDLLKGGGAEPAGRTLANPFADDPSVVDLRGSKTLTPGLLRDADQAGNPIQDQPNTLASMSDEQLERKRATLAKAIGEIQKLAQQNMQSYNALESDAVAGKQAATQAAQDAFVTAAFGTLQVKAEKQSEDLLWKAINIEEGGLPPAKVEAMRKAAEASKAAKAVENGSLGADGMGLAVTLGDVQSGKTGAGDAIYQIAPVASGLMVAAPTHLGGGSPIGALPGAVKVGLDTGLTWTDYLFQHQEYERQEALRQQQAAALQHLAAEQKLVIEEQNRRRADSAR